MADIEKHNPQLAGVLPRNYQIFNGTLLKELLKKVSEIPVSLDYDAFGRIYEYFLGQFARTEGQKGGEFYTPAPIVRLMVEIQGMARALYREWFVHFRFPGHEKLPRVASPLGDIPQGWDVTDLAKVCTDKNGIQTGPFGSQLHESDYSEEGVPVVMPKDLIGFRIRTDTIARIPEETADKLSRHKMQLGDIVYGRRGDIGRRAFLMSHQVGWFCGTGCLRIRPNPRAVNGWYLFNYLGQDDVVGLIAGRAQGVTMPNLNTGVMSSVPVKLPPRKYQDDFARLTFPMAQSREALTAKIDNLRRTRNLLLPRLLSGQVSLS